MDRVQPCLHQYVNMHLVLFFYFKTHVWVFLKSSYVAGLEVWSQIIWTGSPTTKLASSACCVHSGHFKVTFQFQCDFLFDCYKEGALNLFGRHFGLTEPEWSNSPDLKELEPIYNPELNTRRRKMKHFSNTWVRNVFILIWRCSLWRLTFTIQHAISLPEAQLTLAVLLWHHQT